MTDPWKTLDALIDENNPDGIQALLEELPPMETARAVSRLDDDQRRELVELLDPENAAGLLLDLPGEQAADILEDTAADHAADILEEMSAPDQADLLSEVDPAQAEAILGAMSETDGAAARQLLQYPDDTAGAWMDPRFLAFHEGMAVQDVIDDLRKNVEMYSDYEVQYAYVVGEDGRLVGVLRLRDVLMTRPSASVRAIMVPEPLSIAASASLDELRDFYKEHTSFLGVPVVDDAGRLVGIVSRSSVKEAEEDQATNAFLKVSGVVGGEEFRSMPLLRRSARRLSWLGPNVALNIVAASIIALFQDTLQAAIALAVFLPIISDMSGCSGNQAVAVSIRELALGLIRPNEFARVFMKEIGLGAINGLTLGLLLGGVAFLWKTNLYLSLVVGGALALNTILSVLLGGLVPLLLRRFNVDPALASGPILTTVTDMCGFFLVLGLATLALSHIAV